MSTTSVPSSDDFEKAMTFGLVVSWKSMLRSRCSAGWRRRISLILVKQSAIERGSSQLRLRISYFSLWKYSSFASDIGSFSMSS